MTALLAMSVIEIGTQGNAHLFVVRAVETCVQPRRLCVRHPANFAHFAQLYDRLLALDLANDKTLIGGFGEDFMSVQAVECFGGILTGWRGDALMSVLLR